jgi:hypothetical protein
MNKQNQKMLKCNYWENKSENATNKGVIMTWIQVKMEGAKINKSALKNYHYQTHHHIQTHNHEQTQCCHSQTQIYSYGIGMPLVKRLVELQNGIMEILPEIGKGTREVVVGF